MINSKLLAYGLLFSAGASFAMEEVEDWTFRANILNLADSNDHDIAYFYESRLATEPVGSGTADIHFHVIEPRTVRLTVERKL